MAVVSKVQPAFRGRTASATPAPSASRGRIVRGLARGSGLGFFGFGVWLLMDPPGFYATVPGVSATGPLNHHFVQDIGAAHVACGAALWLAARFPAAGLPLLAPAGIFAGLHAVTHLAEWVVSDPVSGAAFVVELAGVVGPAALIGGIVLAWAPTGRAAA